MVPGEFLVKYLISHRVLRMTLILGVHHGTRVVSYQECHNCVLVLFGFAPVMFGLVAELCRQGILD